MILYCGGIEIKVGDKVDADGYVAKVEAIVESDVQQKDWGVEEAGIMLGQQPVAVICIQCSPWTTAICATAPCGTRAATP